MKELRRLGLHLLLLIAAAGFAYVKSQPQDEASRPLAPGEVQLWGGASTDVSSVTYVGKRKTVVLTHNKDAAGDWYQGSVEPAAEAPEAVADAGPHKPKPVEAATFVSVSVAEKLMKSIAPMRAKRAIGEVGDDRAESFGLADPQGTLTIDIGGAKHVLTVGSATMGSADRYVRYQKDNLVYVIDATMVRDLESGAGRLSERQQHAFKMVDVKRATITAADHKRKLIRAGTEGRRFWADASAPDVNDETAANWLKKVERLRPVKFADKLPDGATKIVRIDLAGAGGELGFVEVHHVAGDKDEYFISTEQLRLPASVAATVGEQVRDDLGSVLGISGDDDEGEDQPEDAPKSTPTSSPQQAPKGSPHSPPKAPHGGVPLPPTPPKAPTPKDG